MLTVINQHGPASHAGLLSHDLVVRLDGEPVTGVGDMIRLPDRNRIGKRIAVDVLRRAAAELRSQAHRKDRGVNLCQQ
jgi:S1-C subfamily serine protease